MQSVVLETNDEKAWQLAWLDRKVFVVAGIGILVQRSQLTGMGWCVDRAALMLASRSCTSWALQVVLNTAPKVE